MPEEEKITDKTVTSILKYFFYNFQFRSPQQHTNMIMTLRSFCKQFDGTEDYVEQIDKMHKDPIGYIIKKYPDFFDVRVQKRIDIKKTLSNLDWIFFRDTSVTSRLNQEYSQDTTKSVASRKVITLSEVIDVLGLVKGELYDILIEVVIRHHVTMAIDLPMPMGTVTQAGIR